MNRFGMVLSAGLVAATLVSSPAMAGDLIAFPGAEGFGATTTGGRGGQVIKVTTLAADGPGSLQAALDTPGPRIIVFDVSGVIAGDIEIPHGDVTIAGQTAPGGGITIGGRLTAAYDDSVGNIIVRHVRVRPVYDGVTPGEQWDAIQMSRNHHIMLDHVSVAWGMDETVDLYEASDVTVQHSTIEESAIGAHPEGSHNYGLISGPDGHRISVHHTLFAHHKNRAPAIANGPADVRNNVAYDVRHGFVHHNPATGAFNIVGNSFIRGPSDVLIPFWFDDENGGDPSLSYHLQNNDIDDPGVFVGTVNDPWAELTHPSFADMYLPTGFYSTTEHDFAALHPAYVPVTSEAPATARADVLEWSGAFPRDMVTQRTVTEVLTRTGGWGAEVPSDLMAGLAPTAALADDDGDGMPNDWELDHGLDPQDASDVHLPLAGGYPAIETYINEQADVLVGLAVPPGGEEPVDPAEPAPEGPNEGRPGTGQLGDPPGADDPSGTDGTVGGAAGCSVGAVPSSAPWLPAAMAGLALALGRRRRRN